MLLAGKCNSVLGVGVWNVSAMAISGIVICYIVKSICTVD